MLAVAIALASAPVSAPAFALFAPGRIKRDVDTQAAKTIIDRAARSLDRPPAPIPHLHTEGTLPGHGIRDISLKAKEDQPIVFDLSMAWRLTGDRRYLDAAARYLAAWAATYQFSFNPIDETGFDQLIMATDLTKPDLPPPLRDTLARFWRSMAAGYLDAMASGAKYSTNNWQSHRVKLATMAAFETGDATLIIRAREAYRRQIGVNIRPDGSVIDFADRDALHYVTYDLDPLLMTATTAKAHGEDWFAWRSPTGSSLSIALAWLRPYAEGTKTHVEFTNSTVRFDQERAAAGDAEYKPHIWDRRNAVRTFTVAALNDASYRQIADDLAASTGRRPSAWMTIFGSDPSTLSGGKQN